MKFNSTQSGFSLVETLVAITVLLLVIVGPLTIISSTSKSTSFSNEQVIAFYLAQEGAELAQKARDDIILDRFLDSGDPQYGSRYDDTPWADFSDDTSSGDFEDCFNTAGCGLEVDEDSVGSIETPPQNCAVSGDCDLYYDDGGGDIRSRYTHDSGGGNDQTIYSRIITFENITAFEIRVVSTVEWSSELALDTQSVEVVTYLFDVYGN